MNDGERAGRESVGLALDLMDRAMATLFEASRATTTTDRYAHAQLGALRAGAALLTVGAPARPGGGRGGTRRPARAHTSRMRDVWAGLAQQRPEFAEWAQYFADGTRRRHEAEAGRATPTPREADDALRAAATFLGLVQAALGLPVARVDPVLTPVRPAAAREPATVGAVGAA